MTQTYMKDTISSHTCITPATSFFHTSHVCSIAIATGAHTSSTPQQKLLRAAGLFLHTFFCLFPPPQQLIALIFMPMLGDVTINAIIALLWYLSSCHSSFPHNESSSECVISVKSICRALEGTSCFCASFRCLHLWLMQVLCQLPMLPTTMATLRLHVPFPISHPNNILFWTSVHPHIHPEMCSIIISIKTCLWFQAASFLTDRIMRCIRG